MFFKCCDFPAVSLRSDFFGGFVFGQAQFLPRHYFTITFVFEFVLFSFGRLIYLFLFRPQALVLLGLDVLFAARRNAFHAITL